jgi:hypothetical protein
MICGDFIYMPVAENISGCIGMVMNTFNWTQVTDQLDDESFLRFTALLICDAGHCERVGSFPNIGEEIFITEYTYLVAARVT